MEKDLKCAVDLLSGADIRLAMCRGGETITDSRRGIAPLLELYDSGRKLSGFSAADRVIGKAAAFFYVLFRIRAVYTPIISAPAMEVLRRAGISVQAQLQVSAIRSRSGEGFCPMESAVWDISDPVQGIGAIRETLSRLSRG